MVEERAIHPVSNNRVNPSLGQAITKSGMNLLDNFDGIVFENTGFMPKRKRVFALKWR